MIAGTGRLLRPRLALLNGIAAMAGCLLAPEGAAMSLIGASLAGVTLLAAGGSALNQVMERDLDLLMERTRHRPLPTGELSPRAATAIGGICIVAGLVVLAGAGGIFPPLLGAGALAWYLGIYTPLKRRTPFALLAGAVSGAVPPLVGWAVTGGNLVDFRIVLVAGLLYLWQIPHFWLLQCRHAEDYRRTGLPLFAPGVTAGSPVFRVWIGAFAAGTLLLPLFGIIGGGAALGFCAFSLLLVLLALSRADVALFSSLNLFPLLIVLALYLQR
ncbi:protoheme IX farnesyltransferase [Geobacter hydrogenophilus]|uniref:Protoheme IX farnesyltransferase n=1 Tax=Geobacter hydrogenophilus TaxID=40983 RepID=A0A9W6G0L1_9BACT|nr:protoheme IX farnesyltransferase [Geobacter hydrogenophilus]MBT0895485.1 protoheme IX farnesyltransferase [Geobacter hydrogenophilus]GLI38291.1 protoheme IX farnesyltransferase [Geobacter hydrogenophilus]